MSDFEWEKEMIEAFEESELRLLQSLWSLESSVKDLYRSHQDVLIRLELLEKMFSSPSSEKKAN